MEYEILTQDGRMTRTKMQMYRFLLTLGAVVTAVRAQSCDFDFGWCDWTDNNGAMEWERFDVHGANYLLHAMNPMIPGSGPADDHTQPVGYNGWYAMSKCGGAAQPGDVATITSPDIIGPCTLEFWYTMFGTDLDMSVYLLQKGQKTQVWHRQDVNDDFWQRANVLLSPPLEEAYQVVLETVRGTDFLCNVAFDDVKLAPAPLLKCDFENAGPCALRQDVSDAFDWRWQQGLTETREDLVNRNLTIIAPDLITGPEYDVTLGSGGNGTYMYVESSVQSAGHHARLSSTELSGQCLEFYFHMLGAHSGTLRVYQQSVYEEDSAKQLIWEVSGSHGDLWHRAAVNLNITNNFYIRFEAEVGGYYSNIAIDEVKTMAQPCKSTVVPTTPPKSTDETTVETTMVTTPEPTTTAQTTTEETTTMATTMETTLETTVETTVVTTPEPTTTEEPTTTPMATTTEEPTMTEPEVTTEAALTTVEETTTDVITTTEEPTTPEVTTEEPTTPDVTTEEPTTTTVFTTTTVTTTVPPTTEPITTEEPTTTPPTTLKTTTTKTTTTPKATTTPKPPPTTTTNTTPPPKPDVTTPAGKPVTQKPAPPQKTEKPGGEFANLHGGEAAKSSDTGMVVGIVCGLLALLLLLIALILFIRKKKQKNAGRVSPSPEESELQPPSPRRHQWEAPDSEA